MIYSHSRVSTFKSCPHAFKLSYIDELKALRKYLKANDPLIIGSAIHEHIETGKNFYEQQFVHYTNDHENEKIKLEYLANKVRKMLPHGEYEVKVSNDEFVGFIDFVDSDGNIYDFKYSNNKEYYLDSWQLHIYKHYYKKAKKLFYIFIPKLFIRQKKSETIQQFRTRLFDELEKKEIEIVEIPFDKLKVDEYFSTIEKIKISDFPKNIGKHCDWCEFYDYCQKGDDTLILPKNERRKIECTKKKTLWIYGSPFSGKTTFANKFPDPLMLNTDGNIKFVDAPYIAIKDEVQMVGRLKKKTLSWQKFKDVIDELEKNENEFKTIIVDLIEDLYLACRIFMYDKLGIDHESDDSFRAWDKVRIEFLSTMKRFFNLEYENLIVISHIDTSNDITKKSGDKYTRVAPSMQPKVADKIAGMVDIVARVYSDNGERKLSFKNDEVIFGGGRLKLEKEEIPLDYDEFIKLYGSLK